LTPAEIAAARQAEPPPELEFSGPRALDLDGEPREVWRQAAAAFGLEAVFEPDFQDPPRFRVRLPVLAGDQALRALEDMSDCFVVPVARRRILVARDLPQKRQQLSPVTVRLVPIPERISIQEAQELLTAIQQMLELRRVTLDPQKRLVLLRDVDAKVLAATQLLLDLSRPRGQVHLEISLLSASRSSSLAYGFQYQTLLPAFYLGGALNSPPGAPANAVLAGIGGGKSRIGIGITSVTALANASRTESRSAIVTEIAAAEGLPSSIAIGDRYPIVTSIFVGAPQDVVAPPTINFENLGVELKVTPTIHSAAEVSLELDADYRALGPFNRNGVPAIANRKFQSRVRLRTDEAALVTGLIGEQITPVVTGWPLLQRIPWLGGLFRETDARRDRQEILLVIRPRVTVLPPAESATRTLWLGGENRPRSLF
jgi:general secretion pathway protein D